MVDSDKKATNFIMNSKVKSYRIILGVTCAIKELLIEHVL